MKRQLDRLIAKRRHLERIAARCPGVCDHIYNQIHETTMELIDLQVRMIPNACKYLIHWQKSQVEVYFNGVHCKRFKIRDFVTI